MIFEESWRWFGNNDPVSIADIMQTGVSGIVTALHEVPVGAVWTKDAITKHLKKIADESNGSLRWNVVESLPVHESIKQGTAERDTYIAQYIESIKNLSQCGVNCICYNFMPILDWLRSNIHYQLEDGTNALLYDHIEVVIFDIYILKRQGAITHYEADVVEIASKRYQEMSADSLATLKNNLLLALPGDTEAFTLQQLKDGIDAYRNIDKNQLRQNLIYFLKRVVPVAEEYGVGLAIHPDDPPWPVFGLPRMVSTKKDLDYIFTEVPSIHNGLTFCSGSLGAHPENYLPDMVTNYYERIHFVHLRSVQRMDRFIFFEANHLEGSTDMHELITSFYNYSQENAYKILPMRPDHGHVMLDDIDKSFYPGYSLIGRLKGLAELRGLVMGIERIKT
ncbi:mannonate dehydratase [Neptunitalea lumnitzerae]|uniref:Mannonate dehydratase n=1 Tax=Neptunitalea lumnitzerae TaxID=2965509 RepID=A0ABQ5MIY7_9FLAO|nr:mannonate dehydratase [Neptunitalea sp. Y10]GLB49345.1 mannonate dehydratase [Neptunitalea sp. Y10]